MMICKYKAGDQTMASRMMHYLIAKLVTQRVEIVNYNRFVFGALAPDISLHEDESYTAAHFRSIDQENHLKGYNWVNFCEKYKASLPEDELILGYMVHLVSDACWIKLMSDKYIRHSPEKKRLQKKGYADYWRYNGILASEFELTDEIIPESDITVDEIVREQTESYFIEFSRHFTSTHRDRDKSKFELYPYEEVMRYIDIAVGLSVKEINALRSNAPLSRPEAYYVEVI